jgi:hypothetical protein
MGIIKWTVKKIQYCGYLLQFLHVCIKLDTYVFIVLYVYGIECANLR